MLLRAFREHYYPQMFLCHHSSLPCSVGPAKPPQGSPSQQRSKSSWTPRDGTQAWNRLGHSPHCPGIQILHGALHHRKYMRTLTPANIAQSTDPVQVAVIDATITMKNARRHQADPQNHARRPINPTPFPTGSKIKAKACIERKTTGQKCYIWVKSLLWRIGEGKGLPSQ